MLRLEPLLACVALVLALALVRLARVALVLPMLCLALAHALPCPCPFPCIVLGDPLPVHHGCMLPLATDMVVLHKVAAVDLSVRAIFCLLAAFAIVPVGAEVVRGSEETLVPTRRFGRSLEPRQGIIIGLPRLLWEDTLGPYCPDDN